MLLALLMGLAVSCVSSTNASPRPPASPTPSARAVEHPNFVFLLTDDLDSATTAYMPKLKQLLTDQGTTLSHYYVSLPWCCPSRASTLRGQYAHNTKVWSNSAPNGGFGLFHTKGLEHSTIATWLQREGYRNGLFGKYLNGYPEQAPVGRKYIPPGWNDWVVPAGGSPYHQFNYTLNDNGKLERHGSKADDYLTDVLDKKVKKFVTDPDTRPFFAYIGVYNPHAPATPAPRDKKLFATMKAPRTPSYNDKSLAGKPTEVRRLPPVTKQESKTWDILYRNRLRSMQSVDDMIEHLVNELRDSGRLNNTYFIFTSDNGFHIGQHRMPPGKNTAYEEDLRVPFVIRGPGVAAGRAVNLLAGNIDIAPTLADLAGAKPAGFVDGRSLRPLLLGNSPPTNWRQSFLVEHGHGPGTKPPLPATDGTLEPPELLVPSTREKFYLAPYEGIRTERYLYVQYSTGERELYDLATDPNEEHNIVANNPMAKRLAARLKKLRSCAAASCRAEEDAS